MKLYGSTTSPFVRRIRLYLATQNFASADYQFIHLDIFATEDRKQLVADNPALKVPYLIDGEQKIFDSRVIFRYLAIKFAETPLTWHEENLITLIDSANDSFISLFLAKRSGLDDKQDSLFFNLQNERVAIILAELNASVINGDFEHWHYPAICLYSLIDWVNLRELYPFAGFTALVAFIEQSQLQPQINETDPRN